MKKTLALILATALIVTVFAGCNSNSIKQALSGKEPESIASDAEGSSTELLGGWVKAETPEITDEFMKIFSKATETLTGVEYTPVAYIASQVVAGRNHCVLCTAKATVPDAEEEVYVILYIYEDLQGNATITEVYENSESADSVFFDGRWIQTETPVITADAKAAFDKATETLTGVTYYPIALVATKLDDGYCILCESTMVIESFDNVYALVNISANSLEDTVLFDRGTADNNVQIANPVVGYQTLEDAEKAVGFDITVPADIKQVINYSVISDSILEIEFKGGYLRKARGAEDISGDYNTYENSDVLNSNGKQYSVKGNGGKISLVTWTDGGFTYCLGFENGADNNDVVKLLEGIK